MKMIEKINKFEKCVYAALMAILVVVLIAAIWDLIYILIVDIIQPPFSLDADQLINVLGAVLLVLIGVELLDTIKAYFKENIIHVEIVVLLAIIAVARKVILLKPPTNTSLFDYGFQLMGIGVVMVGLGAVYYLIKKSGFTIGSGSRNPE